MNRGLRRTVRQGNLFPATVLDTHGSHVTVRLSTTGAIYHNLLLVGGPVFIGNNVQADFTTNPPTVVAPSWTNLTSGAGQRYLFGLFGGGMDGEPTAPLHSPIVATAPPPNTPPASTPPPDPQEPPPPTPPPLVGQFFPPNNIWNRTITDLPVHASSTTWKNAVGIDKVLHNYFGPGTYDGGPIGLPVTWVGPEEPGRHISWVLWPPNVDDPLRNYPIPDNPKMEFLVDHHILIVQLDTSAQYAGLYEMYHPVEMGDGSYHADSIAWWDLTSNALRHEGVTTADAAGFPMTPGLVRFDEVATGFIRHALRMNPPWVRQTHIWPARHDGGGIDDASYPPYGTRMRLKASFDISGYDIHIKVILQCLKDYGMMLADQTGGGVGWQLTGEPDSRWQSVWGIDKDTLTTALHTVDTADFDFVDQSGVMVDADSGEATQP